MGTGNVVLRADTGATVTAEGKWHYRSPGVIDVIRPDSGVRGTHVTLQGNGLLGGGTSVASVTLAGVSAAVVSETDSEIVVEAMPAKEHGRGAVIITSDTGATVINEAGFEYLPIGTVDENGVFPAVGQTGTRLKICGTGMLGGAESFSSAQLGECELKIV